VAFFLTMSELPSLTLREACRHIVCLRINSYLFDVSRAKACADPRDKIYGLLGIASPSFAANIRPDYSLSVMDVYKEAFLTHLKLTKRLELLKYCSLKKRQIGGPSWVPDWSVTEFIPPMINYQLCSGESRAHLRYVSPEVLDIVGRPYDTVQTVSKEESGEYEEVLSAIPAWIRELPNEATYITGQTSLEAFASTVCMNQLSERYPHENDYFPSLTEWVETVLAIISGFVDGVHDELLFNREVANAVNKIRGRAMITTREGYMGLAPAGVQPGTYK
jgi:hypothetical protein